MLILRLHLQHFHRDGREYLPDSVTYLTAHQGQGVVLEPQALQALILHKGKGKTLPVTGRGGPYGSEASKISHFVQNRLIDSGEVLLFLW
jgi:hypothetical protein